MSGSNKTPAQLESMISDLKTISIFGDLPEQDVAWLAEHMDEIRVKAGEVLARQGDPLDYLVVLLEGEMHIEPEITVRPCSSPAPDK